MAQDLGSDWNYRLPNREGRRFRLAFCYGAGCALTASQLAFAFLI